MDRYFVLRHKIEEKCNRAEQEQLKARAGAHNKIQKKVIETERDVYREDESERPSVPLDSVMGMIRLSPHEQLSYITHTHLVVLLSPWGHLPTLYCPQPLTLTLNRNNLTHTLKPRLHPQGAVWPRQEQPRGLGCLKCPQGYESKTHTQR